MLYDTSPQKWLGLGKAFAFAAAFPEGGFARDSKSPTHRFELAGVLALAPVHDGGERVGGDAVFLLRLGEEILRAEVLDAEVLGGRLVQGAAVARVVDEQHLQGREVTG